MEYDPLTLIGGKVIAAMIAPAYDRINNSGGSSSKQTAQTAMRLPQLVIDTLRKIAYQENLEPFFTQGKFNVI